MNRRPTVYETVALPLSYIGFATAVIFSFAGFTVNLNGKYGVIFFSLCETLCRYRLAVCQCVAKSIGQVAPMGIS